MNPYDYSPGGLDFRLHLRQEASEWLRHEVEFPAAFQPGTGVSRWVRGEYYQPRTGSRRPLVILLHGVGDISLLPCRWLARSLVGAGIACFIPRLAVHSSRTAGAGWRRIPHMSDDEWFEIYRSAVVEARQVVDWAESRTEIDQRRIAVLGVSFGGFISSIAMGVDERIAAGVLIVSGGNSGTIVQRARARAVHKGYRVTEAEYAAAQQEYARYVGQVAEKGFENVSPVRRSFLNDPMTFAGQLRQRSVLMVNARWDEFIPREAVLDFWEACGKPPITWLPATHTAIWLWYPLIRKRIGGFLASALEMSGDTVEEAPAEAAQLSGEG